MQERKRTRVKGFRFDIDVLEGLKKMAKHANMTVNEYVVEMVKNRLLVYPLIPAFDGLWLDAEEIRSILGTGNADTLEIVGSEMAQKNFSLILTLYGANKIQLDFRKFVIDVLGTYCNWFRVEGEETQQWLTLRHQYGPKWSAYTKAYLTSAYSMISKGRLKVEITDQLIQIEFPDS